MWNSIKRMNKCMFKYCKGNEQSQILLPLDSRISQLLMAPPCGSGRTWSRAVKMTLCLFFLAPMSSVGIRNTNTIFSKKQKLEVRQQLKRLNKPALKTIKVINHFLQHVCFLYSIFSFGLRRIVHFLCVVVSP